MKALRIMAVHITVGKLQGGQDSQSVQGQGEREGVRLGTSAELVSV